MKKLITYSFTLLLLSSCSSPEFCGSESQQVPQDKLQGLNSGAGFTVGTQLSFAVAQEINTKKEISYEVLHSTADTLVLNIENIPNEDVAKKISHIVQDNKSVQNTRSTFVTYNWDKGNSTYKY